MRARVSTTGRSDGSSGAAEGERRQATAATPHLRLVFDLHLLLDLGALGGGALELVAALALQPLLGRALLALQPRHVGGKALALGRLALTAGLLLLQLLCGALLLGADLDQTL